MSKDPTAQQIEAEALYRDLGMTDAEYRRATELLGRRPNWVELGLFSVMWSEHCSYKSSRRVLRRFPTEGPQVLQGPGENAGVVDIGDGLAVAFKMESHNHPSAIEPYQGAATGVGGIIRDIFTMGARPIALLDSLRFGPPDDPRQRYLLREVVAGIAGYGNAIGIPTVGGEVKFAESYRENPLVNAMCVGLMRHEDLARGTASGVGNPVMVVGANTGRDGIHGATFASAEDPLEKERSAVQVGDPFMEKLLVEACLELIATGGVVGIQDMGAAGLTSSSAEMASRAGSGLDIDVALVPRRETGMTPYEVMLSESQERMLVVMERGKEGVAEQIFRKWGLEATVIGRVTDDGMLRIREEGRVVAEVPVPALVDEAPMYVRPAREPEELAGLRAWRWEDVPRPERLDEVLLALVGSPDLADKEWVWRQYDHMVQASTAVRPGADAAVIWIRGTRKGVALCTDGQGRYVRLNPLVGGMHAVAEAARNLVCVGARPLAITDCLNFGNPEKPEVFYQFEQAVEGMSQACEVLKTPVVSGNVSFYNESKGVDIDPTPVVGAVGLVEDIDQICTPAWRAGLTVVLLGPGAPAPGMEGAWLGGSEYLLRVHRRLAGDAPPLDLEMERRVQHVCLEAIRQGLAAAAHDVSEGGLAVALAEMAMAGGVGAEIDLGSLSGGPAAKAEAKTPGAGGEQVAGSDSQGETRPPVRADVLLFGEAGSRIVLGVEPEKVEAVKALAAGAGVPLAVLGTTGGDRLAIRVADGAGEERVDVAVARLSEVWKGAIPWALAENRGAASSV
ncbi:phosphoribosylformylglycinamidine synthase subunit PurL [Kyrpidia spormannii]|uniref:Phosphoribosylformylglycinamidine synthetase subunit II n=1 Tax=Kyrpidia spormannii TaxID=2055160 RepID=A0ACA8Z562_9BACL|nr:phosphoribosylformylglycinamidine synthase subunit PurL [Kyrpidia spormannii]CAB3389485.1 phosphoribosylformylglycinamidine synthetase subunit II [Kyrpidia spormannii]